ncbi:dehypoxanthine futalosine cyclase [bacterium]|nr:dehypoxanthine futalosine cyclase [bacterium]
MSSTVREILRAATEGRRLTYDEGVTLMRSGGLHELGRAADVVCRRLHPEPFRTYNIDRNINYSNVCAATCDFCAFYRRVGDTDAYVLDTDVILQKIQETVDLGGDQILMQGGFHPDLPFQWYIDLLRAIRDRFPQVNIHAFSPPEIHFFHKRYRMSLEDVLGQLKEAGLGSIPGGGGEILVDRVRKEITKGKALTEDWLNVNRVWHKMGGKSTATMMFGHVETLEERVEHMLRIRELQDETGGFTAFISWTCQPEHTDMAHVPAAGAFEYLRVQAISRLFIDNVRNIQSSWVTQGPEIGQIALFFGANDMGSLMIEENVVSQAGTVHHLTLKQIQRAIQEAGYVPRQRNVFYEYIDENPLTGSDVVSGSLTASAAQD